MCSVFLLTSSLNTYVIFSVMDISEMFDNLLGKYASPIIKLLKKLKIYDRIKCPEIF